MHIVYKKYLFMFLSLVISLLTIANATTVFAEQKKVMIASPGFFTKSYENYFPDCDEMQRRIIEDKKSKPIKNDEILEDSFFVRRGLDPDWGYKDPYKEGKFVEHVKGNDNLQTSKAISGLLTVIPDFFYPHNTAIDKTDTEKGLAGIGCGQMNLLNNVTTLIKTTNITNSPVVMGLVYKMQVLAIGAAVLMVSLFGLYYATGHETTDPIKFLIRGFFIMFLIYYIPYIAQDILNVNNMLTYWISTTPVQKQDGMVTVSMIVINLLTGFTAVISAFFGMLSVGLIPGLVLLGTTILIIVVGAILKNVLQMLLWWYFRLIMLMLLVFLSPLYLVMGILPKTAHYVSLWFKYFIAEVFTQSSMILGMWFASVLLGNVRSLGKDFDFGLFGYVMLVYGIFVLLQRIPKMSKQIIGRDFAGLNMQDATNAAQSISEFAQKAGFAISGAATRQTQKHVAYREAEKAHRLQSQMNSPEFQRMSPQEQNKVFNEIQALEGRQAARERRGRKANMFMASFESGKPSIGGSMESIQKSAEAKAKGRDKERKERIYALERHRLEELYRKSTREQVDKDLEDEYTKLIAQKNAEESKLRRYQREQGKNEEEYKDGQRTIDTQYREQKEMLDAINNDKWKESEVRRRKEQARLELEYVVGDMLPIEGYDTPMSRREDVTREANERYKQIHKNVFGKDKSNEDEEK